MMRRLTRLRFTENSAPLALIVLALLAFGLFLGWMGFYWDDWVWIYFARRFGPASLLQIDRAYRPLAGVVLWLGEMLSGGSPLGWQVYNLVLRLLTALSFWWLLRRLWPQHGQQGTWAALLFLVYPGFTHQYVSVNTSRHLLPYALFLLSLGLMVQAQRSPQKLTTCTTASLLLSLAAMLTSEYYYGLELARPLVLWLTAAGTPERFKHTFKRWLPYLLLLIFAFIWRYWVSRYYNYEVTALAGLTGRPLQTARQLVVNLFTGITHTLVSAWVTVFQFPAVAEWGQRVVLYAWGIGLLAGIGSFIYLFCLDTDKIKGNFSGQAVLLGLGALLVGGLPFLVTQLSIEASFPNNRALLPMMFGAVLLLVGLLDLLPGRTVKVALLAAALGLVTAHNYYTALEFKVDWAAQQRFFQQLSWRAPAIEPGTALLTVEVPIRFSSDNSLSGPLNQMFGQQPLDEQELPYLLYYLDLRLGRTQGLQSLEPGKPIEKAIHLVQFKGSTSQALVLYYHPPRCLRLLHPVYDQRYPQLPELLQEALPLSDLALVSPDGDAREQLAQVFGQQLPADDWCTAFEQADLARQLGDWPAVVEIGEKTLEEFNPYHPSELLPFIQAYAHTGDIERARELTEQAAQDPEMSDMLCRTWGELAGEVPLPSEQLDRVETLLGCDLR
jgi:hypothetical protein